MLLFSPHPHLPHAWPCRSSSFSFRAMSTNSVPVSTAQCCLASRNVRPAPAPRAACAYVIDDAETGVIVQYGNELEEKCSALFQAYPVQYLGDVAGERFVVGSQLSAADLVSPGYVVLPVGPEFSLPEEVCCMSAWCTDDIRATCASGLLTVGSSSTLRNAMHAALTLAAVGGVLDALEFDGAREKRARGPSSSRSRVP